jgi:type IV pilus assembly protein PilF
MDRLQRALAQNASSPITHSTIAFLYSIIGAPDEADAHYRTALKLDPDDSLTLNAYGVFLCRENQPLKAMKYFDAALEDRLYRMPEVAYSNAGRCARSMNDTELADKYFRNALAVNPAYCDAMWHLADINLVEERSLQARAFLQRFLDTPCDAGPETLWLGINIERELGDERAVADYTTRLKKYFPESVQMRLLLESEKNAG